jgi:hypothetical protein
MATQTVTPYPVGQSENMLIRRLAEEFERQYLSEDGLDSEERSIKKEYSKHGKRTCARLISRAVLSGGWRMGNTQVEVGDALGVDHSSISDAMRKGEMSNELFIALLFSELRPPSWPNQHLVDCMTRSGFIAVAKHFAGFVNDRPTLRIDDLNELNYELLCEIWTIGVKWMNASRMHEHSFALEVLEKVFYEREVIPDWYSLEQIGEVQKQVEGFQEDAKYAFDTLNRLYLNWADIFAVTIFATEIGVRYALKPIS